MYSGYLVGRPSGRFAIVSLTRSGHLIPLICSILAVLLFGMAFGAVLVVAADDAGASVPVAAPLPGDSLPGGPYGDLGGDGSPDDVTPPPSSSAPDSTGTTALIKAAGLVGAAIAGLIITAAARNRQSPYQRFAANHRFGYAGKDPMLPRRWRGRPFVRNGQAEAVMTGYAYGRPFVTFEQKWITQANNTPVVHYLRVGVVTLPVALAPIRVGPESAFAATFPGMAPVDVDIENGYFNDRYRVHIDQHPAARKYAVDILNPRTVEAILAGAPFNWRIEGSEIIGWWAPGDPADTMAHLGTMNAVADGIPPFLWRDYGARPSPAMMS